MRENNVKRYLREGFEVGATLLIIKYLNKKLVR